MSAVDANFKTTVPQAIAERCGITPGALLDWTPAGDVIQVVPTRAAATELSLRERLGLFDQAAQRQLERQPPHREPLAEDQDRGWSREELYSRGQSR